VEEKMKKYNVLVVDDDNAITDAIEIYLTNENYNIFKAYDGLQALTLLQDEDIHLVIMDIMMPNMDGTRATIKIREDKQIPIIMLSAKSEDTDKILGLNFGADDYITKPFNPLELIARVNSQIRRYTQFAPLKVNNNVIIIGGIELNKESKEVFAEGVTVKLTPLEFKILTLLMDNPNRVFSIEEIYERVWNEPAYNNVDTVTVHIRRIREKIEINSKEPKYLKVGGELDINLKTNKSINLRTLILGICITLLPILLSISSGRGFNYIPMGELLVLLDILFSIFLLVTIAIEKKLILKETFIIKLYSKLFLEIRILLTIAVVYSLFNLYDMMLWGNVFANANTLITFIVILILTYLVLINMYKLYLFNETNKLESYIYGKSLLYRFSKLIKESFVTKFTSSKIIFSVIIFIVYILLIYIIGYISRYCHVEPEIHIFLCSILPLPAMVIILFSIYAVRDINKIKIFTYNISNSNYNNSLKVKDPLFFKDIYRNIFKIEDGFNKSVDNAVRSEKMKSELITNVSHDLKTPLTSIINYVDLLDNDNISDEKRKAYLEILKERSLRLKVLIEDLFEASKAASGNLEMHMEDLDPVALLRQTLGEFEDKISLSNLDFIKMIPDKKTTIYADGKKTFRVFQNLISNILKYSLSGTRVYIDVEEKDSFVSITFKNISEYPLNFTEEEILERFKRGDASRTTDGSGLGLAIAKSLVELQGGIFEIKLDGDLFKVSILLQKENFHSK
jgi:DNA-binding response OmpR family regulator/signal transduction histidine kinase